MMQPMPMMDAHLAQYAMPPLFNPYAPQMVPPMGGDMYTAGYAQGFQQAMAANQGMPPAMPQYPYPQPPYY